MDFKKKCYLTFILDIKGKKILEEYKIEKPVRLIELFAGYGSTAMALKRLGVNFEHWRISEWDVNATASYKAVHFPNADTDYSTGKTKEQLVEELYELGISSDGKTPMTKQQILRKGYAWLCSTNNNFRNTNNIGSIVNRSGADLGIVDTDKYTYILCYTFPCQDISLSGKQAGFDENSGTRSSLLWQVSKLLFECRGLGSLPQVLLMENVNAIHNKKNMPNFQKWLDTLADLGYKTYWQDMNSKDYGVPQNRCRTFAVSLLDERPYIFPEPISLEKRLKDVLEDKVGEEFYINSDKAYQLIVSLVDKGVLPSKSCQQPIDLSTRQPDVRDVANCVKTEQRGIINFAQAETGVAIAPPPTH